MVTYSNCTCYKIWIYESVEANKKLKNRNIQQLSGHHHYCYCHHLLHKGLW